MTGGTTDEPKAGEAPPSPAPAASREARLAEALRANLRRRKAPPASTGAAASPPNHPLPRPEDSD